MKHKFHSQPLFRKKEVTTKQFSCNSHVVTHGCSHHAHALPYLHVDVTTSSNKNAKSEIDKGKKLINYPINFPFRILSVLCFILEDVRWKKCGFPFRKIFTFGKTCFHVPAFWSRRFIIFFKMMLFISKPIICHLMLIWWDFTALQVCNIGQGHIMVLMIFSNIVTIIVSPVK